MRRVGAGGAGGLTRLEVIGFAGGGGTLVGGDADVLLCELRT